MPGIYSEKFRRKDREIMELEKNRASLLTEIDKNNMKACEILKAASEAISKQSESIDIAVLVNAAIDYTTKNNALFNLIA